MSPSDCMQWRQAIQTGLKIQRDPNCEGGIEETRIGKKDKSKGMLLPTQAMRVTVSSAV